MWAKLCQLGLQAVHGLKLCNANGDLALQPCGRRAQLVHYNLSVSCRRLDAPLAGPNEWFWQHILALPPRHEFPVVVGSTAAEALAALHYLLDGAFRVPWTRGRPPRAVLDSPYPGVFDELIARFPKALVVLSTCPSMQWAQLRRLRHGNDRICSEVPACVRSRGTGRPCPRHRFSLTACLEHFIQRRAGSGGGGVGRRVADMHTPLSKLSTVELANAYDAYNAHVVASVDSSRLLRLNCTLGAHSRSAVINAQQMRAVSRFVNQHSSARSAALGRPDIQTIVGHLGSVGAAAGPLLRRLPCYDQPVSVCKESAQAACLNTTGCRVLELVCGRNATLCQSALMRGGYRRFGAGVWSTVLERAIRSCRDMNRAALDPKRASNPKRWKRLNCFEYADDGRGLPDLGRILPGELSREHCPQAEESRPLVLLSYQSAPSRELCTFLSSLAYADVPITLLGWDPVAPRRSKLWYYASKIYTVLRFLLLCGGSPSRLIAFADIDQLAQLQSYDSLVRRVVALLEELAAETGVVVGSELMAVPNWLVKETRGLAEARRPSMPPRWPRFVNSGNYVGRAHAVVRMLNATCKPCRSNKGFSVMSEQIWRRFPRGYSALMPELIFHDQHELVQAWLRTPDLLALDHQCKLFHNNHYTHPEAELRYVRGAAIHSLRTGTTPAFLHWNGHTKADRYRWPYSIDSVAALQRMAHQRRFSNESLRRARLDRWLDSNLVVLNARFERQTGLRWGDVCGPLPEAWREALYGSKQHTLHRKFRLESTVEEESHETGGIKGSRAGEGGDAPHQRGGARRAGAAPGVGAPAGGRAGGRHGGGLATSKAASLERVHEERVTERRHIVDDLLRLLPKA
jgi:hypothetical protein